MPSEAWEPVGSPPSRTVDGLRPPPLVEGQVALMEGAFGIDADGRPALIGGRCGTCGRAAFPMAAACPGCGDADRWCAVELGRRATLRSWTVARVAPTGFPAPHVIGALLLAEGVHLVARLDVAEDETQALRSGLAMALTTRVLGRHQDGREIVGWAYAPASTGVAT